MQFKLSLKNNKKKLTIFGLPQTNHYQQIKNMLFYPAADRLVNDQWGNTVGIFKEPTEISFDFNPLPFTGTQDTGSDYQILLKPNRFINGKDKKIVKLSKKIIRNEKNTKKIVYKLYNLTLDQLAYGKPTEGLYSCKQAMGERVTDCGGFSTFLASLLQSAHIPSRLVVGFLIKQNFWREILSNLEFGNWSLKKLSMHAWLEALLPNNQWLPLDPSIEWRRKKGLTKRKGGFGSIPADRLVTSFGQDFKIKIDNTMYQLDLLQKPISV